MNLKDFWPGLALFAALTSGCSYMEEYLNENSEDETLEAGLVDEPKQEEQDSSNDTAIDAVAELQGDTQIAQIDYDSYTPVSFFGTSAASLGITKIATSTKLEPGLSSALGVTGLPGKTSKSGFYEPSPAELALQLKLESNPHFRQVAKVLNPNSSVLTVAEGGFYIDQSRLAMQEIKLANGTTQQHYSLTIESSFSLIDKNSQVVYRTRSIDQAIHVCEIQPATVVCVDTETNAPFNLSMHWQNLLNKTLDSVLEQTLSGLNHWNTLMQRMTAKVVQRLLDENKIKIRDPIYLQSIQADMPRYLFLQIAEVKDAQLDVAFTQLGVKRDAVEQDTLRLQATATLRQSLANSVDQQLADTAESSPAEYVFILPEAGSQWMQEGLTANIERMLTDNTISFISALDAKHEAINQLVNTYGRVCERPGTEQRNDLCLEILAKYGPSNQSDVEDSLDNVQVNLLVGGVISTFEEAVDVYYPQSIFPLNARVVNAVAQSQPFDKVTDEVQAKKLEAFYLKSVGLSVMDQLGKDLAERVSMTYQEELLNKK